MAKTPEGIIQTYAQEQLKKRGCLVRKISYEGRLGCPDLLVLVPGREIPYAGHYPPEKGKTLFLEIKKDVDTLPELHQLREHESMRRRGADVRVIGSKAQVDALVTELFPQE